jgi:hypothetical protein
MTDPITLSCALQWCAIVAVFCLWVGGVIGARWERRNIGWLIAGAEFERDNALDEKKEARAQRDIVFNENTLLRYHLDPTEKVLMPRQTPRGQA